MTGRDRWTVLWSSSTDTISITAKDDGKKQPMALALCWKHVYLTWQQQGQPMIHARNVVTDMC